jgi:molecular chaperone GrpE
MENSGKVKDQSNEEKPVTAEEAQAPAPVALTPKDIEQLKEKAAKADENWDRLLRQTADLENFKKRAARERQEAVAFSNESLV